MSQAAVLGGMREVVDDLAVTAASSGLAGSLRRPPVEPVDDPAWRALVDELVAQRLTGLLHDAVLTGCWPATSAQQAHLGDVHVRVLGTGLMIERALLGLSDAMTAAGVDLRVLKGLASARLDYPRPGLRSFGDIDLLVRAEQIDDAEAVLERRGAHRRAQPARPGFARRFGKSFTYVLPDGFEADVHRTFVMGPLGLTVDPGDLWGRAQSFEIGDRTLQTVSPEVRLLHAAYAVALTTSSRNLRAHRDLAQLVLGGQYHHERLVAMAQSWQAGAVLATAVGQVWHTLGLADVLALTVWAEEYQAPDRELRLAGLYRRAGVPYASLALHSLPVLPGTREKAAFATSLAMPSREFLRQRGQSLPAYLWRGTRRALRGSR